MGGGGGGGPEEGSGWWVGGVRVDVIEELKFLGKFSKKWEGRVGGSSWVGQGRCEERNEVFVKIEKKLWGRGVGWGGSGWRRGGGGVRVDVNEELEVFVKIQKKSFFFLGGRVGGGGGLGGQGGCERRIEVFV